MYPLYRPTVNRTLRTLLKPFAPVLPTRYQFGVNTPFTLALPNGKRLKIAGNESSYVSKVLFWKGWQGYESHLFGVFTRMARAGAVFVDVGANIGYYTLLSRAYNADLKVVAVEPMPAALHFLRTNLALNGIEGVEIGATALSDTEGMVAFYEARNRKYPYLEHHLTGASGMDVPGDGYLSGPPIQVPVTTLDSLATRYALPTVDLLKIDAEGAEAGVLRGGARVLKEHQPVILFECDPGHGEAEIEAILASHAYTLFNARPQGLVAVTSLAPHNAAAHDFVAVPPRWHSVVVGGTAAR